MKCHFNKTLPFSKTCACEIKETIYIREYEKLYIYIHTHRDSLKRETNLSKNEMEEEIKRITQEMRNDDSS